jgi:hypothetical protein
MNDYLAGGTDPEFIVSGVRVYAHRPKNVAQKILEYFQTLHRAPFTVFGIKFPSRLSNRSNAFFKRNCLVPQRMGRPDRGLVLILHTGVFGFKAQIFSVNELTPGAEASAFSRLMPTIDLSLSLFQELDAKDKCIRFRLTCTLAESTHTRFFCVAAFPVNGDGPYPFSRHFGERHFNPKASVALNDPSGHVGHLYLKIGS